MTSALSYCIEQIALFIKQIFEFFVSIFYTNGYLNLFGYLLLVVISLIIFTSIIDLLMDFIRDKK